MPRLNRKDLEPVYSAADQFVEVALKSDGSLFTPGRGVWTLEVCTDFRERFVDRPDQSGDSFEVKFRRQLSGAPAATIQLAGELLFVHFLISRKVTFESKRSLVQTVLSWSPQPVDIPDSLMPAMKSGIVNPGMAFNTRRPMQLWYLLEFLIQWKELPEAQRGLLLSDPWAFKDFVFRVRSQGAQTQQHALLHLIHPNTFEPITSRDHKQRIAAAFSHRLDSVPEDVDRQLSDIRAKMAPQYGENFTFYQPDVRPQWDRESRPTAAAQESSTSSATATTRAGGRRYWVEKTHVRGRPDRESGEHALGKALWSPQESTDGKDIYKCMLEVSPGDVILHFIDNEKIAGVSRASTAGDTDFVGLQGTKWAGRPGIRVQLRDYVELEPPIERSGIFEDQALRPKLEELLSTNRNLFFKRSLELNQGMYLTEAPLDLVRLLDALYRRETGRGLPHVDLKAAPSSSVSTHTRDAEPTMEWLVEETLWPQEQLEGIIEAIRSRSPQVVLAGPPGTSKTWVAQRLARYLTQGRFGAHRVVQFHPSYSYEQFIEGLRPVVQDGGVQFQRVDGVVLEMVKSIEDADQPHVLVIDEMNRANLPRVFGELMYAFEYRGEPLDLQYSKGFVLPDNIAFIGTMNTADRSIRSIDVALRRRFDVFECPPDTAILERYYDSRENRVDDLLDGFQKINALLEERLDRHHTIGHSFFMANPLTPDRLAKVWRHKIGPLIEEYFFDQPDIAEEFRPGLFWKGL